MIKKGTAKELIDKIAEGENISVFGAPFYNRQIMLFGIDKFIYVCADAPSCKKAFEQLKSMRNDVAYLPPLDDTLCCFKQSIDNNLERLKAINAIGCGEVNVIVTTVLAYAQLYPKKEQIAQNTVQLNAGGEISPALLCERLIKTGYKRVSQIDETGQVAVRGGIVDISPVNCDFAVRLDFFGETIERIRSMDLGTQQGGTELKSIKVCPAAEVFLPESTQGIKKELAACLNIKDAQAKARAEEIVSDAVSVIESGCADRSLNFIKPLLGQCYLDEFFDGVVVFDEQKRCVDNFTAHLTEHKNRLVTLLTRGECFNFGISQMRENLGTAKQAVAFDRYLCANRIFAPDAVVNFSDSELIEYPSNKKLLMEDVKTWLSDSYKVTAPDTPAARELFKGLNISYEGTVAHGAKFDDIKEVYIGAADVSGKKSSQTETPKSKKAAFFQPKINDYVVHPVHGIGLCEGIVRMKMGESERDCVVIRYDEGKLYVACESLNMISAYAGEENPKLNRIGGAEFSKAKEKAKKAIQEMAFDLSKLYAQRQAQTGFKYNPDHYNLSEFEADFPYEETPCQLTAVKECLGDITSGKVMDRLLCGDVGYGKTEVAMRVMYKVVLEGKQAAFISPTTVLSRQHFKTLTKRMGKFGVKIGSLTRFDSPLEIKNTLEGLRNGTVDIVCGTHRTLSKDVAFKDLGLLALDEEQRFGVSDKEKIKLLKTDVNVLSLSATPIPRTLHMSMSGIRDISVLDTPPRGRIEVSTYVCAYSDSLVFDAISREISRGGQAFIVYNRVEFIESYASSIMKLFPSLRVKIAHGQMEKSRLENAINDFMEGGADVLIASTIIENGIDMANVNTMIVVDSDKLGLGQMYQLRGRIGRGGRQAYAYFTFDGQKTLTENAYKRLDAITSYTRFGSGFKLAMADLEIRGAGNVLGPQQHGHIQKIGYDMYLRLINDVMDELNGEVKPEVKEVKLNIDFDAFIPEDYIFDIEWRLKAYQQIALIESEAEAAAEVARLKDVYGAVPLSVKNLILASVIKNLGAKLKAERVTLTKNKCEIRFPANTIGIDFIKKATQNGFTYSAADNAVSLKPKADGNVRLMRFLESF